METAKVRKNEPADERITFRLPQSSRTIIERAAAIYGLSVKQFILKAAVERANEVLRSMETVRLSSRDAQAFLDALAISPEPNERLIDAVQAHSQLIDSKD
jgi:uncharacterized protein (DUF1778 family)